MPLGIVSDEDFELEKNRYTKEKDTSLAVTISNRGKRGNEVPQELREVAAEIALETNNDTAAKVFNLSPSSVAAYKAGAISTVDYSDKTKVTARKRIASNVQNKLMEALSELTQDKIKGSKAKDISGIVKDMAIVHEKLAGRVMSEEEKGPQVHVHLFAPAVKKLEDSDIIDVIVE